MKCKIIAFLLVLMISFDGMSQVSARVMQVKDGDTYVLKVNESTYSGQTEPPIPVETEPLCYAI